jgi:cytochrome c peroxidase
LAEPRSQHQVGLPAVLTKWVISPPSSRMPARAALGQKLFFDARLSANGTVACATCHNPARAFTDGRPTSIGIHGRAGQRNAPTVLNALYNKHQFWDGRVNTLEQLAPMPITNSFEMGPAKIADAASKIAADQDYQGRFMQAFDRGVNAQDMLSAIAACEQTLVSFDSPYDHFVAGYASALNDSAKRGLELFNTKARCNKCHALSDNERHETLFMDNDFHNIGVGILRHHVAQSARQAEREVAQGNLPAIDTAAITSDLSVLGRFLVTRKEKDIASFKTPGLRNVVVTAPYFHDGSMQTLWDVIRYDRGTRNDRYPRNESLGHLCLKRFREKEFEPSLSACDWPNDRLGNIMPERRVEAFPPVVTQANCAPALLDHVPADFRTSGRA